MHVPKTAGTSMRLHLRNQYEPRDVAPVEGWRDLVRFGQPIDKFRLVQGHFSYNVRSLVSSDARMLVVLRDPIARTVSSLKHLMRDPAFHPDHALTRGLSFAQVLREPRIMAAQRNVQASYLCASTPVERIQAHLNENPPQNEADYEAADLEEPPTLALAQQRLNGIEYVGMMDKLSDVLDDLTREMKYAYPLYFPLRNNDPTAEAQSLSESDMEILREVNDIDLPLYSYAKELIMQRQFERRMSDLVASGVYHVPSGSFHLDMNGIMPGSGWYEPEYDGGVHWRWTGPSREFTLELPLRPDSAYEVSVTYLSRHGDDHNIVSAKANARPLHLETQSADRMFETKVLIELRDLAQHGGMCRLVLATGAVTKPTSDGDLRPLGVAVFKIEFRHLT